MIRNAILSAIIFIIAVAILLGLLQYYKILAILAALIGLGVLIALIVLAVATGVALIFAIPYYLLAKKPKVDEYGDYKLENVKGK
ncbi:MAG: hypothetical protein C4B56_00055 [Candidatus Methanophagaceae archaeon]|nr:MAG: hypothetical protein C4B56_00055 [Methanophagales archaeon]